MLCQSHSDWYAEFVLESVLSIIDSHRTNDVILSALLRIVASCSCTLSRIDLFTLASIKCESMLKDCIVNKNFENEQFIELFNALCNIVFHFPNSQMVNTYICTPIASMLPQLVELLDNLDNSTIRILSQLLVLVCRVDFSAIQPYTASLLDYVNVRLKPAASSHLTRQAVVKILIAIECNKPLVTIEDMQQYVDTRVTSVGGSIIDSVALCAARFPIQYANSLISAFCNESDNVDNNHHILHLGCCKVAQFMPQLLIQNNDVLTILPSVLFSQKRYATINVKWHSYLAVASLQREHVLLDEWLDPSELKMYHYYGRSISIFASVAKPFANVSFMFCK